MAIIDIAYEQWQKDFEAEFPDIFKEGSLTGPGTSLRRDLMRTAYMAGKKDARQPVGQVYLDGLDRALGETIDQRDRYHEVADELSAHLARIIGVEIGEHSSDNCPWQSAIDAAESCTPAQAVDLGPVRAALQAAEALCVCCASVDGYSRGELNAFGRNMRSQFTGALALIDGRDAGAGVGNIQPPRDLRTTPGDA